MKWLLRIFVFLIITSLLALGVGYFWLKSSAPEYSGQLKIQGIESPVTAYFDDYGIPHIYAENKHDLYLAFGYLHAQDRLFQLEMMRRAGSGRLSEIIGRPMLQADKMFRSLGLVEYAKESAQLMEQQKGSEMYQEISAYIEGINQFIANGKTPPEFSIIGIEKTPYTIEDMFYITGAMSFSFSLAQRTDPIVQHISEHFGDDYLQDLGLWHDSSETFIPIHHGNPIDKQAIPRTNGVGGFSKENNEEEIRTAMSLAMFEIEDILPFAPFQGSNSWVLSGEKTKSGEVLFCNDTHIGYMIPQTWYEAHLNAPGFEMYGHFLAGIPYALVGRNRQLSWGLTMLLNDDMDFYYEKPSGNDPNSFLFDTQYVKADSATYTIKIKGEPDTTLTILTTARGPIVNSAFDVMKSAPPISMYWTYTRLPNHTVDALYGMNNAQDFYSFEKNLSKIHAPGLNVNYGDKEGNVAWWGCASLIKRNEQVNSYTILDASDPYNMPLGFYPFDVNPRSVNPKKGYIYSANDWPEALYVSESDSTQRLWYPGYYKPQYRADRIRELIDQKNDWDTESIKKVITDYTNRADAHLMEEWFADLKNIPEFKDEVYFRQFDFLFDWNGEYDPMSPSATFFNKMLYHYLRLTMADELGDELFNLLIQTHLVQRSHTHLFCNESSRWWNNVNTPKEEDRQDIIFQAFQTSIDELKAQFGSNPKLWNWRKATALELKHPLGQVALLKPIFSISAKPVYGSNETIMQNGFKLNGTGIYDVNHGAQMRIIVDFAHVDSTFNVTPSGNSGHVMSPYYSNQAELFRNMEFRHQWMGKEKISQFKSLTITG